MEENKDWDSNKDIFTDTKFSEKEKPKVEEQSFKEGFSNLGKGLGHIIKGIWHIFSKQFKMNLLILLLVIAIIIFGLNYIGFKQVTEKNETEPEIQPIFISFPEDTDTSLLSMEGIGDIIAENCRAMGLEQTLIDLSCSVEECLLCESPVCKECVCETKGVNVIHYQCLDGTFVEDKSNC